MARRREARTGVDFYREAAEPDLAARIDEAQEIEGLQGEISLLRAAIRGQLEANPEIDLAAMGKAIDLLVRALNASYRISDKSTDNLAESIAAVIDEFGIRLIGDANDPRPD